jgi:hypothetical protein
MTLRLRQAAVTFALTLPLAVSTWMAGPFATTTSAQSGQRMVGPRFPILIDTDSDGIPTSRDAPTATQIVNPTTLQMSTPVTCDGTTTTTLTFSGNDAGRYTTISRTSGLRMQALTVSGSGGAASRLTFTEQTGNVTTGNAAASMVDSNRDGAIDTLAVSGTLNTTISLVFSPDSGYVSVPPGQAALLGASGQQCAAIPNIWVPLADSNGDGRGDTVVFDLDGNGLADGLLWSSLPLGAPQVPATNTFGLLILISALGGISLWYLSKRRNGPITTV